MTTTERHGYGSRPDLLPRSAVRHGLLPNGRPGWTPRDGVAFLTYDEHVRVEGAALGSLPRWSDGTVQWDRCPGSVVRSGTARPDSVAAAVGELSGAMTSFVLVPGSLAVPSIRVDAAIASEVASAMASDRTELWVLTEPPGVLLEYSWFHDTLVWAQLPPPATVEAPGDEGVG